MSESNQNSPSAGAKPRIVTSRPTDRGTLFFAFCEAERAGMKHLGHAAYDPLTAEEFAEACDRSTAPKREAL